MSRARVNLFLCGDVMTGRGIDQVLEHSVDPEIHEPAMTDARDYVALAEQVSGPIPRGVGSDYVWGDALGELERRAPDLRIVNLETSVTLGNDWSPKGINYRMHPGNAGCLTRARIDCCVLANNHVLDYGPSGLLQTLDTLHGVGIRTAGAGRTAAQAEAPAALTTRSGHRVLVLGVGFESSGIPSVCRARPDRPGVNFLDDGNLNAVEHIREQVDLVRRPGDVLVASLHWGSNWGYRIPEWQIDFAHALVDRAGVDVVHGHSSHHAKGIEVRRNKLILYGCGDFLNDYEGIFGYESFRSDLALMYFAEVDADSRELGRLTIVPLRMRRFRLESASDDDTRWLAGVLSREGAAFGTHAELEADGALRLRWT